MEYRPTLVVLLVIFALRSLAYGKFKLACCWLLWVMFAQMEPICFIPGAPKVGQTPRGSKRSSTERKKEKKKDKKLISLAMLF